MTNAQLSRLFDFQRFAGNARLQTIIDDTHRRVEAAALERLPAELTDIIFLYYYDRMTLTEIAASLNICYGMVKIRHN